MDLIHLEISTAIIFVRCATREHSCPGLSRELLYEIKRRSGSNAGKPEALRELAQRKLGHRDFSRYRPYCCYCSAFFLELARDNHRRCPLLGWRQWYRHGLSPVAHASRLQGAENRRILSRDLRHDEPRRWSNPMGSDAPHTSC